jgi:hypothetical protein
MHKILLTLFAILLVSFSAVSAEKSGFENRNPGQEVQSIYPNPFINTLFLKLASVPTSEIYVKVFDILGNEVYANVFETDKLTKVIELNLEAEKVAKRGVYMVKVEIDGQTSIYRLFKD